jgi:NO-binding membrane sensor protein with MHYT domain
LLTIAICSLHFTAMGAAIITPDPTIAVYPSFIDNSRSIIRRWRLR